MLLLNEFSKDDMRTLYSIAGFTTSIDSIRCAKLALDRGLGGVLLAPSAYFCKSTPRPFSYAETLNMIKHFIKGSKGTGEHEIPLLKKMGARK